MNLKDLATWLQNMNALTGGCVLDMREVLRLRAALLDCARKAEQLKQPCGMDPESAQAVRNSQYQNISTTAHIALGTIRGPDVAERPS